MDRFEVLSSLAARGVTISADTLRRWTNAELVPTPERGNRGRAGGMWSVYPPYAPWEAFAAAHLLKDNSIKQVADIRRAALQIISEVCAYDMAVLLEDFAQWQKENTVIDVLEGDSGYVEASREILPSSDEFPERVIYIDSIVFLWLLLRIKAEYDIPVDTSAQVRVVYYWYGADTPEDGFCHDVEGDEQKPGSWIVKKVIGGTAEDLIIIKDSDTGVKLILKTRKNRF